MNHPLETFKFCPHCGGRSLDFSNPRAIFCPQCGLKYYANVASAVACFITDERGYLLSVVRGREPMKNTLDLPGGFVDVEESVEEAVIREVYEETHLRIQHPRYLFSIPNIYPYSGIVVNTSDLFFAVRVKSFDNAIAADDAAGIKIMPLSKVNPEEFGLRSIREAVKKLLANKSIL